MFMWVCHLATTVYTINEPIGGAKQYWPHKIVFLYKDVSCTPVRCMMEWRYSLYTYIWTIILYLGYIISVLHYYTVRVCKYMVWNLEWHGCFMCPISIIHHWFLQVWCVGQWRWCCNSAVPAQPISSFDPHSLCPVESDCGATSCGYAT